jgi:hypothetical protein
MKDAAGNSSAECFDIFKKSMIPELSMKGITDVIPIEES